MQSGAGTRARDTPMSRLRPETLQETPVYFLAERDLRLFEQRAAWSALAEDPRPGHFRLYNKNGFTTLHVRVLGQAHDRFGWLVTCDAVPAYFAQVLTPERVR
jgi:hypothetical protein